MSTCISLSESLYNIKPFERRDKVLLPWIHENGLLVPKELLLVD